MDINGNEFEVFTIWLSRIAVFIAEVNNNKFKVFIVWLWTISIVFYKITVIEVAK